MGEKLIVVHKSRHEYFLPSCNLGVPIVNDCCIKLVAQKVSYIHLHVMKMHIYSDGLKWLLKEMGATCHLASSCSISIIGSVILQLLSCALCLCIFKHIKWCLPSFVSHTSFPFQHLLVYTLYCSINVRTFVQNMAPCGSFFHFRVLARLNVLSKIIDIRLHNLNLISSL